MNQLPVKQQNIDNLAANEIVLYHPTDIIKIEVRMSDETVWLNRHQMALLFGRM